MKTDVYLTTRRNLFVFVQQGSELPPAVRRPEGMPIKPWRTVDLTRPGNRHAMTEDERQALLAAIGQHGYAAFDIASAA